jgi:uncharacterized heparinase superfamily protein
VFKTILRRRMCKHPQGASRAARIDDASRYGHADRMTATSAILRRSRWYASRLAAMPAREIPHRIEEAVRRRQWRREVGGWGRFAAIGDGPLADLAPLRDRLARTPTYEGSAAKGRQRALEGKIQLLGRDWPLVSPPASWGLAPQTALWFHDPVTRKSWPGAEVSCFDLDVRSTGEELGDVKYVWELNRLQILHPLAAAAARGDDASRETVLAILEDWAEANPPYRGVNWVSGIEIAMRLVSIALTVAAVEPTALTSDTRMLFRRMIAAHGRYLHAFPSKHSSANNHRLAEGLGLFIAGILLPDLAEASTWELEGRQILETEACRQILPDGVGVEQSPTYQAFVMEMLALAARIASDLGEPLAPTVATRLADGAQFLRWLIDDCGHAPAIGDDDEGRVLAQPPDREPRYVASVLAAVAGLTGRPDLAPPTRDPHLRNHILGSAWADETQPALAGLQVFEQGGYTCAKETIRGRRCHLVFDHGPLGFAPLSAHGHADALAIWLTIDDQPILVDAGTYLYFSGRDTRTRLRESLVHNTLSVQDRSQSKARPAFSWASQAKARLLDVARGASWSATASHDGYHRNFGVHHVRRVERLSGGYGIADALEGATRPLPVTTNFLCHPDIGATTTKDGSVEITGGGRLLCRISPPAGYEVRIERARTGSYGFACCSRAFGELAPTTRLVLAGMLGSRPVTTQIEIPETGSQRQRRSVAPAEAYAAEKT